MKPTVPAFLSDITAALTILAALPYELGEAANILHPEAKKIVALVGIVATLLLRLLKRWLEARADGQPPVPTAPLVALLCALFLGGCALSYTRERGPEFRFEPILRDFKAIKELSR